MLEFYVNGAKDDHTALFHSPFFFMEILLWMYSLVSRDYGRRRNERLNSYLERDAETRIRDAKREEVAMAVENK